MEKIKMFSLGILAALGALVLEVSSSLLLFPSIDLNLLHNFLELILIVVLIEEGLKYTLLRKAFTRKFFSGNFIFASFFFGLGFSLMEISFNALRFSSFSRSLLFSFSGLFLIHTATAMLFGWYFFTKKNLTAFAFLPIFLLAFLTHLFFNLIVFYQPNVLAAYFLSITLPVFSIFFVLIRGLLFTNLPKERK